MLTSRMTVARMQKRKYDQSHAAIILRVRQYFEQELRAGKRQKLTHILDRTAATGVSRATICRIKTEEDPKNWPIESGDHVRACQESKVPKTFAIIVRKVRDLFLEKNVVPAINRIYERISSLKVQHVLHFNLFVGIDIPTDDRKLWVWSRSNLHRFMKKIGFVYDDRLVRYEHTKI